MKLDFVLLDNGRYAAAFNPTEGGALEIIQEQGGELYVYAYVDGVNPILIDKDLTKKTAYLKMLDIKGVNIRVESTTPIREACYSGEATKVKIVTGKGEFGLFVMEMSKGEPYETTYEYEFDCFNLGDSIEMLHTEESYINKLPLIKEEQLEKFTRIVVDAGGYTSELPVDRCFSRVIDYLEGVDLPTELAECYSISNDLLYSLIGAAQIGGRIIFTYNGEDYVYDGTNIILN